MTLAQEAEIKLKKYKSLNDDDPSVMQVNTIPQPDPIVMMIISQGRQ